MAQTNSNSLAPHVLGFVGQTGALSPDGKLVASTNLDGTTRLWDAQSGKLLTGDVARVWSAPPKRYEPKPLDNMPRLGPDNFKVLQDQIDALELRVERLENKRDSGLDQR